MTQVLLALHLILGCAILATALGAVLCWAAGNWRVKGYTANERVFSINRGPLADGLRRWTGRLILAVLVIGAVQVTLALVMRIAIEAKGFYSFRLLLGHYGMTLVMLTCALATLPLLDREVTEWKWRSARMALPVLGTGVSALGAFVSGLLL